MKTGTANPTRGLAVPVFAQFFQFENLEEIVSKQIILNKYF